MYISPCLKAIILTSTVFISHLVTKQKITKWFILLYLLIGTSTYLLFAEECEEYNFIDWEFLDPCAELTPKYRDELITKINFHEANGKRTYEDAKARCWYLPDMTDRKNARTCFTMLVHTFGGTTPMSKVVIAILAALDSYGIACLDEWDYIENKLNWSKYHYEMKEFYEMILIKG